MSPNDDEKCNSSLFIRFWLFVGAVLEKFEGHRPKICFIGLETDTFPRGENIILTLEWKTGMRF